MPSSGGQAGLAASYWATRLGLDHVVLDARKRSGDTWRERYDSLTLFTPRGYSSLPGSALEGDHDGYPTGAEMADYLETYAARHDLPIERSQQDRRLTRAAGGFELHASGGLVRARTVVVATETVPASAGARLRGGPEHPAPAQLDLPQPSTRAR